MHDVSTIYSRIINIYSSWREQNIVVDPMGGAKEMSQQLCLDLRNVFVLVHADFCGIKYRLLAIQSAAIHSRGID